MIINHNRSGGTVGKDGTTPHIGANGNWFIGDRDTHTRAEGQTTTETIEVSILVSDWDASTNEVTITCPGVVVDESKQIVSLIPSLNSKEVCESSAIECIGFGIDAITLKAQSIPSEDIVFYVAIEKTGSTGDVYSTEEQVVGTWIDGKPIYRKTLLYTVGCSKTTVDSMVLSLPNISLIQTYGKATSKNYNVEYSMPFVDLDGWMAIVRYEYGNIQFRHKWFDDTDTFTLNITIEYTKTTDEAAVSTTALMDSYEEGVNEV